MDDCILVVKNKQETKNIKEKMSTYVQEKLSLSPNKSE